MPLFRPEALRAQDRHLSEVTLVPPVSWRTIIAFLAAALLAAGLFLSLTPYTALVLVETRVVGAASGQADLDLPARVAADAARGQPIRLIVGRIRHDARIDGVLRQADRIRLRVKLDKLQPGVVQPGTTAIVELPVTRRLSSWLFEGRR